MKKVLLVGLAVLLGIAFVTTVFAQTPAKKETTTTTTTTPATKTTPAQNETTTTTKQSKHMAFTGKVTNMDTAAKMMTATNKKGDMTFDCSSAKMKVEPKAGDKVTVKYMEKDGKMMASSVTMGKATKTTKTTTKKETKETPAKEPTK